MNLDVVILAAGQGTRMVSDLPKVLHPLARKPLLQHVIDTSAELNARAIHVVIGHGAELVRSTVTAPQLNFVVQEQQLGTGHAVAQVLPILQDDGVTLILYGDVPLVTESTLNALTALAEQSAVGLLTVELPDPTGYGRIVRNQDAQIVAIVEERDATAEQRAITEVNTGIMAVPTAQLKTWIAKLDNHNAQNEFYLTDIIAAAVADGVSVQPLISNSVLAVTGVNNRVQLAQLEREHQRQQANQLMLAGVSLADPNRFDVRGSLTHGRDVFIDVNTVINGDVTLGDRVSIGPNCVISNAIIGDDSVIEANSVIDDSVIGKQCSIGPFARLRPGSRLGNHAKIGNFVETKNAVFGDSSKANHLSYIGDAERGNHVNIGAGTITCNYDGANKHKTSIGSNAFIGSNSALVAPVEIGEGATVGAGSTVTNAVPDHALAVNRAKQRTIANWQRPIKMRKE